jgi:type I restriction enzyme, S subunit
MKKTFKAVQLNSVAEVTFSSVDKLTSAEENNVLLCNYTDVYYNRRIHSGLNFMQGTATTAEIAKFRLQVGDVVITKDSESPADIAVPAFVAETTPDLVCGYHLAIIRPDSNLLDGRYLTQLLQLQTIRHYFFTLANGATRFGLGIEMIRKASLELPPISEQRKIADILTTWDVALETLDILIAAKTRQKEALMQQLLSGKTRVKGAKGKWKNSTLADMLVPITRTVTKPTEKFLAAGIRSHGKGVFLKPDFKPEDIALDELFEIKTGDLIVNITFAWEGAAAIVSDQADGALVSHRFPTFLFKDGVASCSFFRHYIRSKRFVFDCGLASPGGAGRNRVLSKSAFLDIELKTPPFEEQQQIGNILDTAEHEITLLRNQRQTLDQQKRGLMQRLLTGKIRVNH